MDVELRPVADDDFPAYRRVLRSAFGGAADDDAGIDDARRLTELDRTLAAFAAGQLVATSGAFTLELTLPGLTTVPAAGVTAVGVLPTHRRRGLMRALMAAQLGDAEARGEPVAVLLASESLIYGRFGFGAAVWSAGITIDRSHAAFASPFADAGRVRLIDRDAVPKLLPSVHDAARRRQPGDISRPPAWWDVRAADRQAGPDGRGSMFWAVHEDAAGEPDGFVAYRLKPGEWVGGLPDNQLHVEDLVAADPEVEAALWRFVLDVDLVRSVTAWSRPVDEPLLWRLADPRQRRVTRVSDFLWLRVLDVPTALAARRYAVPGRLVLQVIDSFRPATSGRYLLDADADGAECRTTSEPADLALGVAELGACFLGGVRFATLARAGRAEELRPGAAVRADTMFASDPAPFCRTGF